MDLALLEKAVENDNNLSIIQTNIQEIKTRKNDVLQRLVANKDVLAQLHDKLRDYRYVETAMEMRLGAAIRWIRLNVDHAEIRLNNPAMITKIEEINNTIAIVVRTFNRKHVTLFLYENLLFQKISPEEQILLKAIGYLSK